MWLTTLSIRRPLIVLIALGALLAFGLMSWTRLGVELLPALEFPIVTVTTPYPGAGPEAVDTLVTRKIEDSLAGLNDVDYIQSTSNEGISTVRVTFTEKASKDSAREVERRVSAIRNELPADSKTSNVTKFDPNAQPIIQLAFSGSRDLVQLQQLAEDTVKKRLESTIGVARVTLLGGVQREIQVHVDQQKLQAHGLSILQVNQALSADNLNVPSGNVTQRNQDWTVRLNSLAQTPAELQNILISSSPAGRVRLRDVATVVDTTKKASVVQRSNGQAAIAIVIHKQASANTVSTADGVKKAVVELNRELPAGTQINVIGDASTYVSNSVADVQHELMLAILLTGLVLLVFLHTLRSTAIVLLAIPTSLVATFGVMSILGLSFNFMSLMGLALTVGILVDDSIVVLENIARHLQMGEVPKQAAINGRSEIGMAAIAITLVDVVVFTPIAFMTGMVGQYFREFGLVIVSATLFSLLVSFTLTPLLASRLMPRGFRQDGSTDGPTRNPKIQFARLWEAGFRRLEHGYEQALQFSLGFRWAVVGVAIVSFLAGVSLIVLGVLSTEFVPQDDAGQVEVTLEMPAGTTLAATDRATALVEQRLQQIPEVETVFTSVGVSGFESPNQSRFATTSLMLKDKSHRQRSSQQVADDARRAGDGIPGLRLEATAISTLGGGGTSAVQVRIEGEYQQTLAALATQVATIVRQVRGTTGVNDGGVVGQPELVVSIDRDRASDLGLTPGQVASVLRTGLAGSTVGTFRPDGTKGWDITVLLNPNDRARVDQIRDVPVITPSGASVRLGQLAQIDPVSGPTQITRRDRQRSVTVTASLNGRPSGDVSKDIQAGLDTLKVPAGYKVSQGGAAQDQNEAFAQMAQALALSVALMYVLMALLFESLLFPFIVMLSLPLALVGAFGLLALTGNTLNLMSMIGMILLTGLVGKNAILLVDYTNHLRKRGVGRTEALLRAGPTRLRPILMTSAALILAMLPLAMKLGEGGEWRAPLAVAVIGGLLTSTFLTLLVIPAVYTLVDDLQVLVKRVVGIVHQTSPNTEPTRRRMVDLVPAPVAGAAE